MSDRPRLHVVALAHLDTQWRWTVRDTARDFLPATVAANEPLFDRYPGYVLSFEGAHRYRLLEEHHPDLFEVVRRRVAQGRWAPSGAAVEAFDTLLPSPESIVRQIALGRRWFRERCGVDSRDLFLPDCFGFPASLPTIAAHAGIVGFSTQKLRRGALMRSAYGIPFPYGIWRGRDGSELLAALDPGEYSARIEGELESDPVWRARFEALAAAGRPGRLLTYVGTGDKGGAAPEPTVAALERALAAEGPIEVVHGRSEAIFLATTPDERDRLPSYEGELLLRLHGTGCAAAKAILKRWNRRLELLAHAAECAASLASAAGRPIGTRAIDEAWWRFLAHQMHDDLTGTSIPAAYRFSLDALGVAANQLAEATLDAVSRAAAQLDRALGAAETSVHAVLTTTASPRTDLVEIALTEGARPTGARLADDRVVPVQLVDGGSGPVALVPFAARGIGLELVVLGSQAPPEPASGLVATGDRLENERLSARFDAEGRLSSLIDRTRGVELLAAPVALELLPDRSRKYPAWEIRWEDLSSTPIDRFAPTAAVEVVERGPLRAALRIAERARGVVARWRWSLAAGGESLELALELDWHRRGALLELRFPFAFAAPVARFDDGLGGVERPVSSEALYEGPAQAWAALDSAADGGAIALLTDRPLGWNRPDAATLRATLLHAPSASFKYRHQSSHDFGRHLFRFAIVPFAPGASESGAIAASADRFQQRPRAFRVDPEPARSGPARSSTLLTIAAPLRLLALRPSGAERLELRLSNGATRPSNLELDLDRAPSALAVERETDGSGDALAAPGGVALDPSRPLPPSALRTLELAIHSVRAERPATQALALATTLRGFGRNGERSDDGGFDGRGRRFPRELAVARLDDTPVPFELALDGGFDCARADGQTLAVDAGHAELWLLGASVAGDRTARCMVDGRAIELLWPDWRATPLVESGWSGGFGWGGVRRGRFARLPFAWSVGHLHDRDGRDLPVERGSLFALCVPLDGARSVVLPRDPALRIVAATASRDRARIAREAFVWPEP